MRARRVQAEYGQRYRALWNEHWWWRSREAFLLAWIERLHRRMPRRRILDVGCGDGLFFDRLQKFGQVEGIEPDASLVHDPRWRPQIRIAPLEPGSFAPGAYDLVLMLDVLEHIADDHSALVSARSALRPGGHLVLTVPALSLLWSRHDEANAHYRRYPRRGLRGTLDAAGFEVETVRYFFFWTVAPMLLRRVLAPAGTRPRRGRLRRGDPPAAHQSDARCIEPARARRRALGALAVGELVAGDRP